MFRRILSLLPNKPCFRSVAVNQPIDEDILRSNFKKKDFSNEFGEQIKKRKFFTFKRTSEDLYIWCSSIIGVSSIIYWHKWFNQSPSHKKFDEEILNILKKLSLENNIVLAVNPGSKIYEDPSASLKNLSLEEVSDKTWECVKANFKKTVDECSALLYNKLAMQISRSSNHKTAFDLFLKASENGSIASLYNIGLCYELGHGVNLSLEKAAEYYKLAADKGHLRAMYNLSSLHYQELANKFNNSETGFYYMKLAADNGLVKAQLKLALIYTEEKKYCNAVKYFEMAANQNDAESLYYLAICYDNGFGVKQDTKTAMLHYKKAAEMGYAGAQYIVGHRYKNGHKECPKDLVSALKWYKLAQKSGYKNIEECIELLEYEIKQHSEEILLDALDLNPIKKFIFPVEKHIKAIHKSSSAPCLRPC
ncbi:DAP3-binding cell death enhancer 1 isoform X1 [Hydra vulgaris]|uniref:Death ligand signal enhancer n=1 Tax=Hydra vulgaris TaxID=6087 RepID=T2MDI1_HYDVU|nr:DAP3-binding cell death enhancer 1 isoform X1 [Hydra vulgaris]